MGDHTVQQGDTISSIAAAHGIADWRTVYDHEQNADLRELRPDPDLLFPGDVVFVPERERPEFGAATSETHTFRVRSPRNQLILRLLDGYGEPLANTDYSLTVGGQTFLSTTDDDGRLEHSIPVDAVSGSITYLGATVDLQIGWLDPMETVEGVKARLQNLGYSITTIDDDETSEEYVAAVRAFQADQEIDGDGTMTDETRERLGEAYGC